MIKMADYPVYVHPDARIGAGVEIGPFSTITANVEIGEGTRIMNNATILDGARIGRNCVIFPGAVVSGIPQDLKFRGEDTVAVIGDNTVIRECVTVNRGTASKGRTVIGSGCLIMAYTHVAHDCLIGNNVIISNATQLAGEVVVDDCAVIGGGTLVHQFCRIGGYVMIQGGAHINKDVPPYIKAAREPIQYAGLNSVGLRRRGFTSDQMREIQDIYHLLFQSDVNTSTALRLIAENLPDTEIRRQICDFVSASTRGILKGYY